MKFKKFPENWKEVELGEICEILTGFAFKSSLFNEEGNGRPLIRIRDLLEGKSKTYYSGEFEEKYLVKNADFLIGMDGEFKIFEWKSKDALLNQRVCKLILDKSLVFPKYIFYMISKKLKEIEDKTPFVTVKHISNKQILSIRLMLPPISVQETIVSILEKAEKLKEKRQKTLELSDDYLKSVFGEMFLNKGFEEVELVDEKYFKITMGQSPSGASYNRVGKGMPFFQGKKEFGEKYPFVEQWTTEPSKIAQPNDILLSVRAPVGSINLANIECCIGRGLASIRCNKEIKMDFVYSFLKVKEKEIENLGNGSTFKAITSKQLLGIKIPLPPLPLQQKFSSIVEHVEKMKEKQKESYSEIKTLFDALMQKAFNGELVK